MPGTSQVQSGKHSPPGVSGSPGQASSLVPSHSSPLSVTLSPHVGSVQVVRQALARVSELDDPSSHCSPASRIPSPQKGHWHLPRHSPGQAVSSDPSHASAESVTLSPQVGRLQSVRQASG